MGFRREFHISRKGVEEKTKLSDKKFTTCDIMNANL